MNRNDAVLEWLNIAANDLGVARALLGSGDLYARGILFNCQQCAEKALKAILAWNGVRNVITHDLLYIRRLCLRTSRELNLGNLRGSRIETHCMFLNDYAVRVRYPNHGLILNASYVNRGINSAERIFEAVCRVLGYDSASFFLIEVIKAIYWNVVLCIFDGLTTRCLKDISILCQ